MVNGCLEEWWSELTWEVYKDCPDSIETSIGIGSHKFQMVPVKWLYFSLTIFSSKVQILNWWKH